MISLTMDAVPVIEGAHDRTTECAFFRSSLSEMGYNVHSVRRR